MGRRLCHISASGGFSLIELLLVVAVLGVCAAFGAVTLSSGVGGREARGAAQTWQAASAWAQVGVLWQGGSMRASYDSGRLSLHHQFGLSGGSLGRSAPVALVSTNVARWRQGTGATVTFGGRLASPDGGGSLFFHLPRGAYRVVVRPESGLTVRSGPEVVP